MTLFFKNPEFRRNLWLEISPTRLILMPALIALVLAVIGASARTSIGEKYLNVIYLLSAAGFMVVSFWGASVAGSSLVREFSDGTWDSQRMSSLTPWQMVWGKLFGSTLYAWYGGAMLMAVFIVTAFQRGADMPISLKSKDPRFIGYSVILLISAALFMQSFSMLQLLYRWREAASSSAEKKRVHYYGPTLIFAAISFPMLYWFPGKLFFMLEENIVWWNRAWYPPGFIAISFLALTFWTLIGLWQAMRSELLLRNTPVWGLAFMAFCLLWSAGFVKDEYFSFFLNATATVWISAYIFLLVERKDQMAWLRLIAAFQNGDTRRWLSLLPQWFISLPVLFVLCIAALWNAKNIDGTSFLHMIVVFIGVQAFLARDIAWILWLNLASDARRPFITALVSLALVWIFLPFFSPFLIKQIFWLPFRNPDATTVSLLSALTQAAFAFWLLYTRYKKTFGNTAGN